MSNLERLGNEIAIGIEPDEHGFTGRECPQPDCEGYFKVQIGTGLKGDELPCHCPYCGHTGSSNHFYTKAQVEYGQSVAMRQIMDAFGKDLKELEFDLEPSGPFGIGFSLKVDAGSPHPIHYYRERQLETEVVCPNCTLHYSVYGVFAYCPDCGQHNSLQILEKNFELALKMLNLADAAEAELAARLIENALEDCVSAFDGFARECCRVHANKLSNSAKAERLSFQNLQGARAALSALSGVDLSAGSAPDDWQIACRAFQKRHLIAHKMGVVDDDYVRKTADPQAVVGRKVGLDAGEVRDLVRIVGDVARHLAAELRA